MLRALKRRFIPSRDSTPIDDWAEERRYWMREMSEFYRATYGLDLHPLQAAEHMVPPREIVTKVQQANKAVPDVFFASGYRQAIAYQMELLDHGFSPSSFESILEMGVGFGRLLIHYLPFPADLHGCDVTQEAVDWTRQKLAPRATIALTSTEPPLPYVDGQFDFIYANSVFTHISCRLMEPWVEELRRVLRPGGALILTTLDANHYLRGISYQDFHRRYDRPGCTDWAANKGVLMGNYLTRDYLYDTWGRCFNVLELRQHYRDQSHLICTAR